MRASKTSSKPPLFRHNNKWTSKSQMAKWRQTITVLYFKVRWYCSKSSNNNKRCRVPDRNWWACSRFNSVILRRSPCCRKSFQSSVRHTQGLLKIIISNINRIYHSHHQWPGRQWPCHLHRIRILKRWFCARNSSHRSINKQVQWHLA